MLTNSQTNKKLFPLLILAAWTAFGLFFGTQNYIRDIYRGHGASLPGYLVSWILCGYSWALLTVPVIRIARRLPQERLGWLRFFGVHMPLAAAFALAQIGIYVMIATVLFGTGGRGGWEFFKSLAANELLSSILVYFVIVSVVTVYDNFLAAQVPLSDSHSNGDGNGLIRRLAVKENGRIVIVDIDEIDWIESCGNYVFLHTPEHRFIVRDTMTAMKARLDPDQFVRIRRSAIVRIDQIVELRLGANGEYEVSLRCGQALASTRRYRKDLEAVIRS